METDIGDQTIYLNTELDLSPREEHLEMNIHRIFNHIILFLCVAFTPE